MLGQGRHDFRRFLTNQFKALKIDASQDGLGIEGLKLLVYMEKTKRAYRGQDFDCLVTDMTDLENILAEITRPTFIPPQAETRRIQLIIHIELHYLTVDFKISKDQNQCFILDAYNDQRMSKVLEKLKNHIDIIYIATCKESVRKNRHGEIVTRKDTLQMDAHSCPMFAFDHALQISLLDIYAELAIQTRHENGTRNIDWDDLPPPLVWNAQSYEWLNEYREKHVDIVDAPLFPLSFNQYLKQHEKYSEILEGEKRGQFKLENGAINDLFYDHGLRAREFIKNNNQRDLTNIVFKDALASVSREHYGSSPSKEKEEKSKEKPLAIITPSDLDKIHFIIFAEIFWKERTYSLIYSFPNVIIDMQDVMKDKNMPNEPALLNKLQEKAKKPKSSGIFSGKRHEDTSHFCQIILQLPKRHAKNALDIFYAQVASLEPELNVNVKASGKKN